MRPLRVALVTAIASIAAVSYERLTVEIPAQNMLVARTSDSPRVVAAFAQPTRLPAWDGRLTGVEVLPYWRWEFDVTRDLQRFQYGVTLSIMGSPEEALKYHARGYSSWRRGELEEWAAAMLHRFEADSWNEWMAFRKPPTEPEEAAFKAMLGDWFQQSHFANQGIRLDRVVVNLPRLLEP